MRRTVWLGSVGAAFVVGSMVGAGVAHGDSTGGLEARVAALESWKAAAGVFTQDTKALGHPWTFAPTEGNIVIRSVNSDWVPGKTDNAGKVTLASGRSGASNESFIELDARMGSELASIKAARDLAVKVAHDENEEVSNDANRKVSQADRVNVGADQTISVGQNHSVTVGQNGTYKAGAGLQLSGSTVSVNGRRM